MMEPTELYDPETDLSVSNNLAGFRTDSIKELEDKIKQLAEITKAKLPKPGHFYLELD